MHKHGVAGGKHFTRDGQLESAFAIPEVQVPNLLWHSGALWHYGAMALWHSGTLACSILVSRYSGTMDTSTAIVWYGTVPIFTQVPLSCPLAGF